MKIAIAILRGAARSLVYVAIFAGVLAAGLYFHLRTSLPRHAGQLTVAGARGPIEIVHDGNAVPHVFAGSVEDAMFGLGYAHAKDRLWQMELGRRAGAGRLSEIVPPVGPATSLLDVDRTMRGLGVYRRAQESLAALSSRARAQLDAYAAGVNAHLRAHEGSLGLEFTLLQLKPEPWSAADSLVIGKLMALQLDGNWRRELVNARLLKALGEDRYRQITASPGESGDATLSLVNETLRRMPLDLLHRATESLATAKREASNEWVVDGAHSRSGKPLLANDPHLGLTAPATWYLARLAGPGFDLRGASMPGTPGIVLGHNGTLGWGFTTTNLDSQDLFIEKIDPTNPGNYVTPDGSRPFTVREETIAVRFGTPVKFTVRETRHGPVINDFLDAKQVDGVAGSGHVLALQATALLGNDTSAEGFLGLGLATNWEEFLAAARKIVSPMQNIAYADTTGNIGMVSPGRVPLRRRGDGSLPMPGWSGEFDWAGFVPFEELPRAWNPPGGVLVNANARVMPDSYRHFITRDWADPYRQRRAAAMLAAVPRHGVGDMIAIQEDTYAADTADMLPPMLVTTPRDIRQAIAISMLRSWNRRMLSDRPEPLIYAVWLREFGRAVFVDELDEELLGSLGGRTPALLARALRDQPGWCDDARTPVVETCAEMLGRSLDSALDWIAARHGPDPEKWRWADEHVAAFRHLLLDGVPLLRDVVSVRFPADGGNHTLNRAAYGGTGTREPFAAGHGATYRAIYDFADLDNSRFAIPLGQSGNPLSGWYRNFVPGWQRFDYVRLAGFRFSLQQGGLGTLTLSPAPR